MQNKKLPYKRYQIGYVFRDEPVTSNRFRQITQCDIDIIGSNSKDEAEILAIASEILEKLGIEFTIYINNRKLLNEILEKNGIKKENFDKVIKEIDKIDKLPESDIKSNLKKYDAEKIIDILKDKEKIKKYNFYFEIEELMKNLDKYGVEVEFLPSLARGLSYYNSSVFEIKTKKMKESICGGGSYIFNGIQSTGIAFGLERLSSLANIPDKKNSYIVISLDKDKEAIKIAQELRKKGNTVTIYYGKPSKALQYANSYNIKNAIFVGENELKDLKKGKIKVKDMKTGKESYLNLK